jgi:ribosomal protein S18 acetylase RimI-like enzyme
MSSPYTAATARPEELEPALRLVFQHLAPVDLAGRVANALALIAQKEIDPEGVAVVRGKAGLLGAMVSQRLPGATGLVWPPQAIPGPNARAVEDCLVGHAWGWLRQGGAKMAQAILVPEEAGLAQPLLRHEFAHITSLCYLRHALGPESAGERPPDEGPLTFQTYPESDQRLFHETLVRTYEGTLDCPELNGVRTVEEIIEGHKAQGKQGPALWWLAWQAGQPAGVLLLTRIPEWEALDISYLGVVASARGRGLGKALTRKAVAEGHKAGVGHVTLAVDQRNLPAYRMYLEAGFTAHGQREVYLRLMDR